MGTWDHVAHCAVHFLAQSCLAIHLGIEVVQHKEDVFSEVRKARLLPVGRKHVLSV